MKGNSLARKLSVILLTIIVAGLPVLAAGCGDDNGGGQTTAPTSTVKQPLKIGIMYPQTGVAAAKGQPMAAGVLDAIKYINEEKGGVLGHQIEVISRDNGYDAAKATTIINEFISSKALMFTTQASAMMSVVMGIANEASLPGFTVFSAPSITQPAKHIYAQMPDYGDGWAIFADYYIKNVWKGTGKPKMALMLLNNSTGYGAKDAADKLAATMGIEIVAIEEHTSTTANEIEALTRIAAKNPDVIFISSTPQPTSIIVKGIRDIQATGKFAGLTIGCGHASYTSQLVDLAGAAKVEGVYGVFPTVSWGENVAGMAKMTEYVNKYHPDFKNNMDYITAWAEGLLIAKILETAIQNTPGGAANLTPANVEKYGFQMLNYDVEGLHGPVKYTAGDNRLSKGMRVFQVKSGVITAVSNWINAAYIDYGLK
ncbi:ABC transporter substrate-binding protein [Dehalogenimonas sp. 4OHTPN]|uniref:ABC transporter substrate-binding protein n=1 Tax=Dehalogenimonas sp. 4OHTPN TaxID=3166643 RepID=A0AAU8G7B2_9CHLR